jgi:hypothetical protein
VNPTFSKILVPAILALSFSAGATDIEFKGRGNFSLALDISKMPEGLLDFKSYDDMMNHLLNNKGAIADEKSKVWIRKEATKVELNCFDCLVINSNNNIYDREPHNEERRNGGF